MANVEVDRPAEQASEPFYTVRAGTDVAMAWTYPVWSICRAGYPDAEPGTPASFPHEINLRHGFTSVPLEFDDEEVALDFCQMLNMARFRRIGQ